jgi:hypothetical protein
MSEPSILDAHLAEIDRRLGVIQSGLAPVAGPPAPGRAPAPRASMSPSLSPPRPSPPRPDSPPVALRVAPAPTPIASDPPASDPPASELIAQLRELTEAHARLLTATRELLASCAGALAGLSAGSEPPPAAPAEVAPAEVSVSAGPFASTEALRGFERALGRLPEVREVSVRAYEGDDRAVVDVHLVQPTS